MLFTHSLCSSLLLDDRGSDLIEYALVASLLALCAVSSTANISNIVQKTFNNIANQLSNAA